MSEDLEVEAEELPAPNKPTNGEEGEFETLRMERTDDNGKFIEWFIKTDEFGRDMWYGEGSDNKIYTIKEPVPVKTGVVEITEKSE